MARYTATRAATHDTIEKTVATAQRGQWITLDGSQGRVAGISRAGTIWIMWTGTAGRRVTHWRYFCRAFKAGRHDVD